MMRRIALLFAALLVAGAAGASETARSPDGRYMVAVFQIGAGDEDGTGAQALVLSSASSKVQRRLLVSKSDGDYSRNTTGLSNPMFSLDGGFVYFSSSDVSPNSTYVHQFDLKLNSVRPVCPGMGLRVMRSGPYRGWLLVQKHRYWPRGGSYNPVYLVRPSGKEEMMVPGSDNDDGELAIEPWLAKMKWRAW
jgi:hypothetical protein